MKLYRYLFLPVPVFLALALLAALWFAAPQRTQATGTLALHLPLDETAGATTFADISGNGHNAACTGAACPTAGVAGQEESALQFDGVDDYIEVPYAASLNPGSFTVMAWAKATGGAGTYRSVITSRGDGYGYILYATAANEWQFWIGHGTGWEYLGNTPVVEGEWIHLAGVYDGGTQDMNFYVNGEAAGSLSNRYLSPNTQYPLRIGAGATEQAPVFFFNGLIDDVRVYDGALTQAEIQDAAFRGLQARDDVYTGRENTSLSVPAPGVLANDILTGSGPLTATLTVAPTAGDLSLALDGGFVYTPALDFIGTDIFTYTAHAGELAETAVVTLTVEPNYPPVAISDRYTTTQGVPVTALQTNSLTSAFDGEIGVAGNMFDLTAAETIRITGFDVHVTTEDHTVEVYYKAGSYVGAEQTPAAWTLLGSQTVVGQGQSQPTPVEIGDLTIPAGQTYALYVTVTGSGLYYTHSGGVYEDGALTLTVGVANTYPFGTIFSPRSWNGTIHYESHDTVLANDSDANGDALTANLETGPAHGDLAFSTDGSFVYTPTLAFAGDDTFTYSAGDGELTDTAVVTITVGANNPPLVANDAYTTTINMPLSVAAPGLLANDTDPEGLPLSASLVAPPTQGTAVISPDGSFIYTPATDFLGQDSFTYLADDGVGTATAIVTLNVIEPSCYVEVTGDDVTDYASLDASALQTAVNNANPGDLIRIAGTCAGVQTFDVWGSPSTQTVVISQNLTLRGGYWADDWTLLPDPSIYTTTLDAQQAGQVIYITGATSVTLEGLRVTGGQDYYGAGLYNAEANLTLRDVLFEDNQADGYGGGVISIEGHLTVIDSTFRNNRTLDYDGGGILVGYNPLTVTHTTFYSNTAAGNGGGIAAEEYSPVTLDGVTFTSNMAFNGGGMSINGNMVDWEGVLDATRCTFQENEAQSNGGGLYAVSSVVTVTHSDFYSNTTVNSEGAGASLPYSEGVLEDVRFQGNAAQSFGGGVYLYEGDLTVTGGDFQQNRSLAEDGGGLYASANSTLNITQSDFYTNTAYQHGGGIYNGGTFTLTHSLLHGNQALQVGGGVFNVQSDASLSEVTFRQNEATLGGGMYNSGWNGVSNPTLTDVVFDRNVVSSSGGGMYNYGYQGDSSPTLTRVTFNGNSAHYGGGLYNYGESGNSSPALTDVTFNGNTAVTHGGGMVNNGAWGESSPTLTHVTFHQNSATDDYGGAIYFDGNSGGPGGSGALGATIVNGLFVDNGNQHIGYYGQNVTVAPHFTNCTFSGATSEAVRIVSFGSGPPIDFSNSIFWGNNGDITNNDAALNVQNSIVEESAYPGSGNLNANPLFVDAAGGNLRLAQGSPAIDAGDNGLLPAALTTDLDGLARIVAGTVDMGAYESQYEQRCSLVTGLHVLGDVQPVTLDFTDLGDLACVTATYFPVSHPHATVPLQTGAFWTISGEDVAGNSVTSGFTATLTLPFSGGDATTRACRWLEGTGPGAGWDCGEDVLTTYDAGNQQVSRDEVTEFSDWAAGSDVGPTAVSLHTLLAASPRRGAPLVLLLSVLLAAGLTRFVIRRRRRDH